MENNPQPYVALERNGSVCCWGHSRIQVTIQRGCESVRNFLFTGGTYINIHAAFLDAVLQSVLFSAIS